MDTKRLTAADVSLAAELLKNGGLVGIPTETVYGLGANGLDPQAVARVFAAKGRPQDNPLILHVPSESWLGRYCEPPHAAFRLAARFWPGPLTLVMPRKALVPDAVTAGLDTVAVRCPDCPVTREVIALAGVPVAAPSGNASGRPSPTTAAAMLEDMDGKIDAVLDAGPCRVGVESTILDLTVSPPRLLRPGGVTLEALRAVLGEVEVDPAVTGALPADERPRAPGMKYRHYAPKAPVTLVRGPGPATAAYIRDHLDDRAGVICFEDYVNLFPQVPTASLGPEGDLEEQARRLFEALRRFDRTDATHIFAQSPPEGGLGLAITNRLSKAAGYHIVELEE